MKTTLLYMLVKFYDLQMIVPIGDATYQQRKNSRLSC